MDKNDQHYSIGLKFFFAIFAMYIFFHCSMFTLNQFATDDYMQKAYAIGSLQLNDVGLLKSIKSSDAAFFINNQFNFFDPQLGNNTAMQNYGSLPWWTKPSARLHLWRPLSSLTHWLDYQLFPQSPYLMHLHNAMWLILSFVLVFLLYRTFLLPPALFFLAIIIYSVDVSIAPVVGWIAARNSLLVLTFLPMCLYFLHKASTRKAYYAMALLCYLLALLSAEAGIVVLAYALPYLLFVNKGKLWQRILLALPFLVITIIWRYYYQLQGYGSVGISQYIDPVTGFSAFAHHAITQFPLLFLEVITGVDSLEVIFSTHWIAIFQYVGWVLALALLYLCFMWRARYQYLLFWYFSCVLSLVPGLVMYSTDPRIVIYAHISFAVLAAYIIYEYWHRFTISAGIKRWLSFFIVSVVATFLICLQMIAMLLVNYLVLATQVLDPNKDYKLNYGFSQLIDNRDHVVLINYPDAFRLMYYPYLAEQEGFVLPKTLRQISYAQNSLTIKRLTNDTYQIAPEGGFMLHPSDIKAIGKNKADKTINSLRYAVFFDNGQYEFNEGDIIHFAEMVINIQQVDLQHRPLVVNISLSQQLQPKLLYWNVSSNTYQTLPTLAIGESFYIKGMQ